MADDIEFVSGLLVKPPHDRAPDFVKASISIKVEDLKKWLSTREGEWVNIDVKEARGGKWYACVNNYKPKEKAAEKPASDPFEDSDLPF